MIAVPRDANVNGAIQSKLDNGILTITLPNVKDAQKAGPIKLEIQ